MNENRKQFQLSKDIEHYLAALSKVYRQNGERTKQEILVNAQVRVHEEWSSDYQVDGHALFFSIPESIYLGIFKERDSLQHVITDDLNKIHNVQDEFIAAIFIEMETVEDQDWRRESGVLLQPQQRVVAPTAEDRIWGDKSLYRLFLSHKAEVKTETFNAKERLKIYGVSAFVAHADIHPTQEWQDEIENALASMDAFAALLTTNFHESDWTDQEVGYALQRGVPLIAVKLERDPYGFMGKFQALKTSWDAAPVALVRLLVKQPRMVESYLNTVERCSGWDEGNALAEVLNYLGPLTSEQAGRLQRAYNTNSELRGSFGFNGKWSSKYGPGLAFHLTRLMGKDYFVRSSGEID